MSCTIFILTFLFGAIISALLTVYCAQRRTNPILGSFAWVNAAIFIWCFTAAGEICAPDVWTKYLWTVIQYIGSQTAPAFFFIFVLRFIRKDRYLTRGRVALFLILPLVSILFAATNPLHHLLWPDIYLVPGMFACTFAFYVHGPWYWVEVAYSYTLLLGGMMLLLYTSLRRPPVYSLQTRFVLAASLIPVAGNILYALFPEYLNGFDPTPALFALTCILIFYAITRLNLFDLIPVMCEEILQSMGEGVVVLDQKGRIVQLNPAAEGLLSLSEQDIGKDFSQMDSVFPIRTLQNSNDGQMEELSFANGRTLSLRTYKVFDRHQTIIGTLLILFDITDRIALEQNLREHSRDLETVSRQLLISNEKLHLLSSITRHDILNELTVLQGYLDFIKQDAEKLPRPEYLERCMAAAGHIGEYIRFTKYYENIGSEQISWLNLYHLIEQGVRPFRDSPVVIQNLIPKTQEIYADPLLSSVFGNLTDNAIRHGGTVHSITFSLKQTPEEYLVICQDDGTGVPDEEKKKIFRPGYGKNTGYGLFLIREILAISDITISEEGIPGQGAQFVLHIPTRLLRIPS